MDGSMDWSDLFQDKQRRRAALNGVRNPVFHKTWEFLDLLRQY
jgi:hypothetical protein